MAKKTNHRTLAKLDALYARLPTVACRGLCSVACGPIPLATVEAERMRKADPQRRLPMIREDATCGYLTTANRCGVYAVRPLICRVWGVLKRLSCIHGCIPDRWLSDHEFLEIGQAIERLGGPMVASGFAGPVETGETFLDITPNISPEDADRLADVTRALRVIHGGRVLAVHPSAEPRWVNIDEGRVMNKLKGR